MVTNITISGGGLYSAYTLGVILVIQKYFDTKDSIISCGSGGCFPALVLNGNIEFNTAVKQFLILNTKLKETKKVKNYLYDLIRSILMNILSKDTYKTANSKIFIAITKLPEFKKIFISEFESNHDFINCIITSCYIPILLGSSVSFKFRDMNCIDGDFTLPKYPVIPNSSNVHIDNRLIIHKNMWTYKGFFKYPNTSNEEIIELIYSGYNETLKNLSIINKYLYYRTPIYKNVSNIPDN